MLVTRWWPLLVIAAVVRVAPPVPAFLARFSHSFAALASRTWRSAALVALIALLWPLSLALVDGVPQPLIHDDDSCLLGGKMLAEGHAAFTTHPLWPHFEAFHALQRPSYASKYPVGQQLLLALGIVAGGLPLIGSWLAVTAAAVLMQWALRAALPPAWALAGGLAAAIHPVMLNWGESYRGGGLAAAGGALLFGACLRIAHGASSFTMGALAGAGGALLVVSRPFEGAVLAVGCLAGIVSQRRHALATLLRPAATAVTIVLLAVACVAMHNRAVTGSARTLPWVEYARQYDPAPQFLGQDDVAAPRYRNAEFETIYRTSYRRHYERVMAPGGLARNAWAKLDFLRAMTAGDPENRREALLWPLFLFPLAALPRSLRRESAARFAFLVCVVFLLAPLTQWVGLLTHYVAPGAAAALTLYMLLVHRLAETRRGQWLAAMLLLVFLVNAAASWRWWTRRVNVRAEARQALVAAAGAGQHLFLVPPDVHDLVANEPDIDAARVVWARELADNRALLAHFRGRNVWRVEKTGRAYRLLFIPSR